MCGITGKLFFNQDKTLEYELIKKMCDTLIHRGPDDEGIFVDGNFGFGMRRLSIIDIKSGHQPIFSRNGELAIVFNGEIYNYPDLKKELEGLGHRFVTNSDTETILKAYQQWGMDFPNKLNGMFAIAIWDSKDKKLILVRDRIGVKPLYYYLDDEKLLFGSEIKAILADDTIERKLNYKALDLYLSLLYVPNPYSMIEKISKLPPAHYLICQNGKTEIHKYWNLEFAPDSTRSIQDFSEEFNRLFEDSVKIRMLSEVPLGAFLSGGIDSSAIVAKMAKNSAKPVKTFSIGFKEGGYHDETIYAELIAKKYNTDHITFKVGSEVLDMMEKYVYHFDEPFADYAAFPTYIVSKLAKEHVTVVLTGDGGDELFAGYDRYLNEKIADVYRFLPRILRLSILPNLCNAAKSFINPNSRAYTLLQGIALRSVDSEKATDIRYLDRFEIFGEADKRNVLIGKEFAKNSQFNELLQYWHDTGDNLNNRLNFDILTSLPEDMLTKVDRVTMAVSLEARVPFLDYRIVELSAKIPSNIKLNGLKLKSFLKNAFQGELPPNILNRAKHGFSSPLDKWLREDLSELVLETLSQKNLENIPIFNFKFIKEIIYLHFTRKANHGLQIFMIMIFVLWFKRYKIIL